MSELSEILPHKVSRGQEAADMTVRGVNKNEKEFKGGIIACTQRAGILVKDFYQVGKFLNFKY